MRLSHLIKHYVLTYMVTVQGCGGRTNIAVIVIRLDAKPSSAAAARHSTPSVQQVRESRDQNDVTGAAGESALPRSDDEFVRAAVNIEGSKGSQQLQQPASAASTPMAAKSLTRQKLLKRRAGARDVELRHASPSSSLSSGSSGQLSSRADKQTDADVVQLSSSTSTDISRSFASRIAVFEQLPSSTDSMASTHSSTDGRQRWSADSHDQLPATTGAAPDRRAAAAPGQFKLNASADDVAPARVKYGDPPAASDPGRINRSKEQQDTTVKHGDRVFDSTRL